MAKKVIKVNSNPNKTPASGMRNPTLHYSELDAMNEAYERQRAEDAGRKYEAPSKKTIKVNSNPVKGKTVIGPLARGGSESSGRGGFRLNPFRMS